MSPVRAAARLRLLALGVATLGLAACASAPPKPAPAAPVVVAPPPAPSAPRVSPYAPAQEDPSTRGDYVAGGLYKPGVPDSTPDHVPDVDAIPEPAVVAVPRSAVGNRASYTVLGKSYRVMDDARGYVEQGTASYYGSKFHGRRTSNLEVYDMYAFTAAHKTLPLPSFARVTNLDTGKSVVVRVNDRGPFHDGRLIDLSYAAAVKLGITKRGTGRVEVRALHPGEGPVFAGATPAAPAMGAMSTPVSVSTSPMDRLLADAAPGTASKNSSAAAMGAAPAAAVPATAPAGVAVAPAPAGDYRFDMRRDGHAMSADEFDRWMQARRVRVATGRPGAPAAPAAPAPAATVVAAPAPAPAAADTPDAGVTLQVASFSARGNADRALAMLHGAGIDGARLYDAQANGQPVWRLRVGPLAAARENELAARIAGLGFGMPRRVHD